MTLYVITRSKSTFVTFSQIQFCDASGVCFIIWNELEIVNSLIFNICQYLISENCTLKDNKESFFEYCIRWAIPPGMMKYIVNRPYGALLDFITHDRFNHLLMLKKNQTISYFFIHNRILHNKVTSEKMVYKKLKNLLILRNLWNK